MGKAFTTEARRTRRFLSAGYYSWTEWLRQKSEKQIPRG